MANQSNNKKSIASVLGTSSKADTHMQIRSMLSGPNGAALMEFLMEEYVLNVAPTLDPHQLAWNAGQADLVLRLRRYTTE